MGLIHIRPPGTPGMVLYTAGSSTSYPNHAPDGIRLHFLGGAREVGNVGCIIEDRSGTRVLIDYGLAPTKPPKYPSEAPPVKHAIMTHAHIDHIGMAPWLTHHGTTLHGTDLTAAVSEIMWADTYKVSDIEGYPLACCLLYTSPSPRDVEESRMPSSA